MKRIFITRRLPSISKQMLENYFLVDENNKNEPLNPSCLPEIISKYDGILCTVSDKLTEEVLAYSNELKVISNFAVGLDNIDVEYAKSKGISVYNTSDIVTNSTADLTLSLLLSLVRKIPEANNYVKQDKWKSWDPNLFLGEELFGKKFGILGFGNIGQAVAKRALGFGLKILFFDPYIKRINDFLKSQVIQVDFNELLIESDYISIHLSLTEETYGMINSKTISMMKKKPLLLNLSRGEIIITNDLINSLKNGDIRSAALDVTHPEPISGNHPLCNINNCLIVPHIGTATYECRYNMAKLSALNIINHFSSKNE